MWMLLETETPGGFGSFLPVALAVPGVFLALYLARLVLDRFERRRSSRSLFAYATLASLGLGGILLIIILLPIEESTGQLLTIVGVLLSAAIAVSSTNFLGNVMAGLMLRTYDNFRVGDFIGCEEHFGRVTERGLLHTELQTEDRDLTTLPNLFLATRPVKVVRASGTLVSAAISLGYDVPRKQVRALLLRAAESSGLKDPFCQILNLGDFSVEYRVGGLLEQVTELLSTRTRLRGAMLDRLHEAKIEIVSPTFMNTRGLAKSRVFIPDQKKAGEPEIEVLAEDEGLDSLAFDKADLAVVLEQLDREREGLLEEREDLTERRQRSTEEEVKAALADELSRLDKRLERVDRVIELRKALIEAQDER